MIIEVKPKHIMNTPLSEPEYAISFAFQDFGTKEIELYRIYFYAFKVYHEKKKQIVEYKTEQCIRNWIENFYFHKKAQPFKLILEEHKQDKNYNRVRILEYTSTRSYKIKEVI